jgi:signal recognition particle receptor subunit beta
MVLFNYSTKELTAKVVYYGPGLCGKTTNLQYIHGNLPETVKGKMLSLATKTDRTLFFDFLPLDLGTIRGMKTRIQLYTVPGQVFYNETRKLVLKGADGIVFVADSQEQMMGANVESFRNLEDNLKAHGMDLAELPHVIQFNKRDLPKLSSIESLNSSINKFNAPFYESVATTGIGVQDTLKAITKLVLLHLTQKYDPKAKSSAARRAAQPAPPAPPAQPVADAAGSSIPLSVHEEDAAADPVPVAGAEAATPAPPPPPEFNAPAAEEDLPTFGETEIEDLVGEVAESDGGAAAPGVASTPIPAPPVQEEKPPEPLTADDPFPMEQAPETVQVPVPPAVEPTPEVSEEPMAAAPAEEAGGEGGDGFEIDRGFDPEWSQDAPGSAPVEEPMADDPSPEALQTGVPEPDDGVPFPPMSADEVQEVEQVSLDEPSDAEPMLAADPTPDPLPMDPEPTPAPDPPVVESAPAPEPVLLTEVAEEDDALFSDPSLEVTRIESGGAREIVVPVEIGEGTERRRFKLSVTLRLDPVE